MSRALLADLGRSPMGNRRRASGSQPLRHQCRSTVLKPFRRVPYTYPLAIFAVVLTALLLLATHAAAQVVRPFTERFTTTIAGDIRIIGNTLLSCENPGSNGCSGNNNNHDMEHFKDTPDPTVLNRSTATLALPSGATVAWAGLYWGGRTRASNIPANRNQMQFRTPLTTAGTYETVTSQIPLDTFTNDGDTAYQGFTEVTTLVRVAGSGTYVGADVKTDTGENAYAGWALVVVFASPALPNKNLIVFDGFANVSEGEGPSAERVDTTISGFLTPLTGAFTTRLGMVVYEGDADLTGDQFRVNNVNVSDAANPSTNFFNSTNAFLGANVTSRDPSYANMLGFDIDLIDASGILPNGARDATLTFTTNNEQYYPGVLTFSNDIFQPVFPFLKGVADLNGGAVEPGDVLQYTLIAENNGNDPATDLVLTDSIPANTTYEPGSLAILTGANVGVKTDAAGDDEAEFTGTAVRFRVGAGANATTGGVAQPGARGSLRFRVRVNAGVPGDTVISNQAQLDFNGATTGAAFTTLSDGDLSTAGSQPTTVTTTEEMTEVTITKMATPNPVVAGQNLTYTLTVANAGPGVAADTVVTDATPANTTFVSASAPAGWAVTAPAVGGTGTVTFSNPALAVSVTALILVVRVDPGTTTAISNTATIATPTDPTPPGPGVINVPLVPAQDLSILKDGPARAAQGQELTYSIAVTNPGPLPALNVVVTDPTPPGTTFVAAAALTGWVITTPAVGSAGTVTYTQTILAPGTTNLSLTVRVDPTVPLDTTITNEVEVASPTDSNPNNNMASTFGTVVIEGTDLAVTKEVDDSTPLVDDQVTYTLTVNNFGPSDATGVVLADLLPAGVEFVSADPSQGTYNDATGEWDIGDLDVGDEETLEIEARVTQAGVLTNTATGLDGDQTDPDASNNQASVDITVRAADIAVTKSVDNTSPVAGDTVIFTVTATNNGPNAAMGVRVEDLLPVGLSFVSAAPGPGTTYDGETGAWQIAALAVSASATLQLTARVETTGTIINTATSVASTPFDPNPANNTASATLTATPSADLAVTKTVTTSDPEVGAVIAYTVTVENHGPSAATGVVIRDLLPLPPFSVLEFFPSQGAYNPTTGLWIVGTLALDAKASLRLIVRVEAPGTGENTAEVQAANEPDPVTANNTASVSVVAPANDVAVTKTVDNATPPLGGLVTYTIRITNSGPNTAEAASVADIVGIGSTEFVSATASAGSFDPILRLWTGPDIPVGASATLTLTERVTSLGLVENVATANSGLHADTNLANNVASASVTVQPVADIAVTKTVSDTTPTVGDTITFTVTATNNGPNIATGVQLSDGLPAGLTFVNAIPSQGAYDPDTGTWAIGILTNGAAAVLQLMAQVEQAGELTNIATKTGADQFDPDSSNNASGVTLSGDPSADIQVRKMVDNPVPNVGDDVTFTLTVRNAGPSAATGVQVTDRLLAGLTFVSATPSQGTYSAATGVWNIGMLANGASATLALVATVEQAGARLNLALKTAQGEEDPVLINNAAGALLNGQAVDIAVTKSVDNNAPTAGETVTFTVTATNNGPSAATGVQVTDRLPAGLEFVSATPSQGTYTAATGVWNLGALASSGVGATATLQIEAEVTQAAPMLNTTRRTATDQTDLNPLNNLGVAGVVGPMVTDVSVTKAGPATVTSSGTVTYTVVVSNAGPDAADGTVITDAVPPMLSGVTITCVAVGGAVCLDTAGLTTLDAVVIPTLPSGSSVTFTISGTAPTSGSLSNSVNVTPPPGVTDPDPGDNVDGPVVTEIPPVPVELQEFSVE